MELKEKIDEWKRNKQNKSEDKWNSEEDVDGAAVDAMNFHTTSIFLQFSYRFSYDWKPLHSRHIHKKKLSLEKSMT